MGFFARLKWLLTGEGEAPAGYKSSVPGQHRPHDRQNNNRGERHPRGDRDRNHTRERDNRGERNDRGDRSERGGRPSRDGRDGRDNRGERGDRGDRPRHSGNGDRGDRFGGERGDRHNGQRRGGHEHGRRQGVQDNAPRQIDRPAGGPSSTMRPAQSSAAEGAAVAAPRAASQGPERVGVISNYSDDARIASVKMEKGTLRSGDWIEIQGNISSLRQKVESLQLGDEPIQEAAEGQEVSMRALRPVKVGDAVVRLRG